MISATSMATPSAISDAHWAASRRPPRRTNSVSTGSTAKIELSPSESETGSKTWVYKRFPPLGC